MAKPKSFSELARKRKDHWLPQGYLRGFIVPTRATRFRPLYCFDVRSRQWEERSPKEIAYGKGFYDYAEGTDYSVATHPDSVFARLEREFPQVRDEMAANAFAHWEKHKEFLKEFMQMLRARSPLAMRQQEAAARNVRASTVTHVSPDRKTITLDSLEGRPLPEQAVRNFAIRKMLEDVQGGASWMNQLDWCLRYTDNESEGVSTTDQAVIVSASIRASQITMDFLNHPDTLLVFPVCWQACLFGSTRNFDKSYDRIDQKLLERIRSDQKRFADRLIISPATF